MTKPRSLSIIALPQLRDGLAAEDREVFDRLFHLQAADGSLDPPSSMHPWIKERWGSVDAVTRQRIVKITNLVTWEGALFNGLRASRPIEPISRSDLEEELSSSQGGPFCHPLEATPSDTFGRVRGAFGITASNVAKYDGWHGLVIFDRHDPLEFTEAEVIDHIETAWEWARRAHAQDPRAVYYLLLWNGLWRGGASILHGHLQMTLSQGMHYAKVEALRRAALAYHESHGTSYFDDLVRVHQALGLAVQRGGAEVLVYLTPVKEKELVLLAPEVNDALKKTIYWALDGYLRRLGVTSFNLVLYHPPLAVTTEDWSGFPAMVRLVDRGDSSDPTSDIGAMELYAASVIASDPFEVVTRLSQS